MREPLLQLQNVSKTYPGVRALKEVSFHIDAGEVVGLIGENGAGKSTLMKVLGGVVEPSAGIIRVEAQDHAAMTQPPMCSSGASPVTAAPCG
jgi:ribose transport system ATP-binding protein